MRHTYPIEQLLRPPVELYAAAVYAAVAGLVLWAPGVLLLPGALAPAVAALCLLLGLGRLRSGLRLLRYQYRLCQLPLHRMQPAAIPRSAQYLYIGLGFEWKTYHAARRADLLRSDWRHLLERDLTRRYALARRLERLAPPLRAVTGWRHYLNPVAPIDRVEGRPETHGVGLWEGEQARFLAQAERGGHLFVVGTTGVGKTRLAEVLISQDIHDADNAVIVFDPKGDAALLERMYAEAKRAGRLHQFTVFHLGFPDISARYNPLDAFARITEVAGRVASNLPSEGQSAAFKEFTWRYVNVIAKAAMALGHSVSYQALLQYGSDIDGLVAAYLKHCFARARVPDWEKRLAAILADDRQKPAYPHQDRDREAWACVQVFRSMTINDVVASSLVKTFEYDKKFYDKLVASLFPFLEKVTSGEAGALLSPDYFDLHDPRPIFDWRGVLRQGGIVYVGLDALGDAEVATAVGSAMFSDLTSTASLIYKFGLEQGLPAVDGGGNRKIRLHLDEFNELVGRDFVPMANKARGAGFELTAYTQSLADVEVRFGDRARAEQVIANLGTLIMLRVKGRDTAELLTRQMRDVEIKYLDTQSLVTDSSEPGSRTDFVSRTGDVTARERVPLIHPDDIVNLPKGHAFALVGGKPYKLRLPWIEEDAGAPASLRALTGPMRRQYRSAMDLPDSGGAEPVDAVADVDSMADMDAAADREAVA